MYRVAEGLCVYAGQHLAIQGPGSKKGAKEGKDVELDDTGRVDEVLPIGKKKKVLSQLMSENKL